MRRAGTRPPSRPLRGRYRPPRVSRRVAVQAGTRSETRALERAPGIGRDLVALLRPRQWYKNLLLFVGLVFGLKLAEPALAARALGGFALFCLAASGVYALNDVLDAKEDRLHPRKRFRPVAAGRIGARTALGIAGGLFFVSLVGAALLQPAFFGVTLAYVLLQVLYVLVLKHQVFLDLFSIASGLLLRAVAGVVLVGVTLSPWLLLCTFFLALFLGLGKRRAELRALGDAAGTHRRNLTEYTEPLLAQATTIVTATLIMSYSLYAFFHPHIAMMATIPFAMYGLLRYLYLVTAREGGEEAEAIFRDAPSLVNLALWGATAVFVLYSGPERALEWWAGVVA